MTKTPKWLPDGSGIDPDSLDGDTVVETLSGFRRARHAVVPIVRVFADVTPPKPDPRVEVVAQILDRRAVSLTIAPIGLRAANAYVTDLHRHHGPTRGHKFSIACLDDSGRLCGVAIGGRPVARGLDDGRTLEVLRVCTDGTPNACSKLYGAMRRAAREMGYLKVITYTLAEESGTSLRAAGWSVDGTTHGGSWDRPGRERTDRHPIGPKTRWAAWPTS